MKRSFVIALHAGYWLLYLLLLFTIIMFMEAGAMTRFSENQQYIPAFIWSMTFITILPGAAGFYASYIFLFNRLLAKKKIVALIFSMMAVALAAGFFSSLLLRLLSSANIFEPNTIKLSLIMIIFMAMLGMIHSIIALVIKGFVNWYADIKFKEELQQKNFETELALVKSQLNPHFLFNSINNIDVLIKKDADKASLYLNKLSDIMRFMLYETKTEKIPLAQELNYIEKYIELQKIRTANKNFINYSTEGSPGNWTIAPMLFIPFIENAFKHAANKKIDNGIVISVKSMPDALFFCCENQVTENPLDKNEAGGLGNELLKKRLNLLYPGKHNLTTGIANNVYKIVLTIHANED